MPFGTPVMGGRRPKPGRCRVNPWTIIGAAAALVMGITLGIGNNPEVDTWGLVSPSTVYSLQVEGDQPQPPEPTIGPWTGPGCKMWADTAIRAGFTWDELWIALQVAELESGCLPDAIGDDGHSFGLMQINDYWCEASKYWPNGYLQTQGLISHCTDLLEPLTNLHVAWHIATHYGWENWSTYGRVNG